MKITFMGAGSTVFAKNLLGDCMLTPSLRECEIALYDIDGERLHESELLINALNESINESRAKVFAYLGVENRKDALRNADFVVNAIQVGGYEPCTVTDFEIPKKYGLRQTIADTLGIGGIMRALRTIPILEDFTRDMHEVCPDALFLNYTNPMAMLTGYLTRYSGIKSIGLCHSVQACSSTLLNDVKMQDKMDGRRELIAGINHMAWLLEIKDKDGNDLYPEIRRRACEILEKGEIIDPVRLEYVRSLGYYCTESSEHNAEYNCFFIKDKHPELIKRYGIPLDEYPRRCVEQIKNWAGQRDSLLGGGKVEHTRTGEFAWHILDAIMTGRPEKIGGNVLNNGLIDNLDKNACVEVPCLVDSQGIHPCRIGSLPVQLAAMNMTNINVQLITIEAAMTKKRDLIYNAAMLEPHTASELTIDEIKSMVDDLIAAHGDYLPKYH